MEGVEGAEGEESGAVGQTDTDDQTQDGCGQDVFSHHVGSGDIPEGRAER